MKSVPLSRLPKGVSARIESIVENPVFGTLDRMVGRRLADLGFSDGMPVTVIALGPFGKGPYAVRLGNLSQFSLRNAEAEKIICRVEEGGV